MMNTQMNTGGVLAWWRDPDLETLDLPATVRARNSKQASLRSFPTGTSAKPNSLSFTVSRRISLPPFVTPSVQKSGVLGHFAAHRRWRLRRFSHGKSV
jgi:hypothetical protein